MIFKILKHDWLAFVRSPMLTQSIGQNILLGLFGLYMFLVLTSLGFLGGEMINERFPDVSVKEIIYKYLIYWWTFDLMFRFMLQKFPSMTLRRYLTLNISRKTICHFMVSRSIVSFFNIAPYFFIVPFYLFTLSTGRSSSRA